MTSVGDGRLSRVAGLVIFSACSSTPLSGILSCMNTSFVRAPRHNTQAFTLIEILVVISIIAVLCSLLAAQAVQSLHIANQTKALYAAMELKNGLDSYHTDYNRFPLDAKSGGTGEDTPEMLTDGSNSVVDALLGVPPAPEARDHNPLRIQYANLPQAKGDRSGIVGTYIPRRLHDLWGQPYRILLDTNGDNQVQNPDVANSDPKVARNQARHLGMQVAVYSAGKDGVAQTKDDVVSWR